MPQDHPTANEMKMFFKGTSRTRKSRVVHHLLTDCPSCREQWVDATDSSRYDYSAAFSGAQTTLDAFFAQPAKPWEEPEVLLSELQPLSAEDRAQKVSQDPRYGHPSMVEAFIEQSHLLRYQHPQDMLHFGNLARLAAESCTVDAAGSPARLADSRACGWMQYANALRVSSEFAQADEAFERAGLYRKQGTGDPLLRARLAEKLASLRTYQGRFREAVDLAVEAGEVYRELEQDHSLASTMIQQGVATLYAGDSEEAVRIFNNAIPLIDQEANPHLLLAACHNLVRGYIDLERPEQALSIYFEARDLYEEFDDTLILLRTRWQEGQLLRDLGHLRAAETALIQARKGFLERNLSHEVALVSLDLAWVYVRLRRSEELKQTVAEAVPIFRALRVGRETLAALLQLQHACGQEQQALDLISLLNRRLAPLSNRQATQK